MQPYTCCAGETSSGSENDCEVWLSLFSDFHEAGRSRKGESFQLWKNLWKCVICLVLPSAEWIGRG